MRACAKINLTLHITGRREDGYHLLESLFWPLKWLWDDVDVSLKPEGGISMMCLGDAEGVPCDERNLCWKAAAAFMEAAGVELSPAITLTKHIPTAAGLGGGSSDAAAVLLELRRLAVPDMDDATLAGIAVKLGADVPFFLKSCPCAVRGIGEELSPVAYSGEPGIFLVNPGFPVPAAWAYTHWREHCPAGESLLPQMLNAVAAGDWAVAAGFAGNDLEHCVVHKFPVLALLRERMEALGIAQVHVSGSGPTLFGFAAPELAAAAEKTLLEEFGDCLKCFYETQKRR